MDTVSTAWLAALFEGEGTIVGRIYSPAGYQNRRILFDISQSREWILIKAKTIILNMGIDEDRVKIYKNNRKMYHLTVTNFQSIDKICTAIWPWLSAYRKGQIQEAMTVFCFDFVPTQINNADDCWSELIDAPIKDTFPVN